MAKEFRQTSQRMGGQARRRTMSVVRAWRLECGRWRRVEQLFARAAVQRMM